MPNTGNTKTRAALRLCEKAGVLNRIMVPYPVLLDGESARGIIPPRLFYLPAYSIVAYSVGDPSFYDLHPEFTPGGLSKELYILDKAPIHLSNFFAMEDIYSKFSGLKVTDALKGIPDEDSIKVSGNKPKTPLYVQGSGRPVTGALQDAPS